MIAIDMKIPKDCGECFACRFAQDEEGRVYVHCSVLDTLGRWPDLILLRRGDRSDKCPLMPIGEDGVENE